MSIELEGRFCGTGDDNLVILIKNEAYLIVTGKFICNWDGGVTLYNVMIHKLKLVKIMSDVMPMNDTDKQYYFRDTYEHVKDETVIPKKINRHHFKQDYIFNVFMNAFKLESFEHVECYDDPDTSDITKEQIKNSHNDFVKDIPKTELTQNMLYREKDCIKDNKINCSYMIFSNLYNSLHPHNKTKQPLYTIIINNFNNRV